MKNDLSTYDKMAGKVSTSKRASNRDAMMFGRRMNDDGTAGDIVFIDDIPKADYGRRCGLICATCGRELEAVRKTKGDVDGGFAFLRHSGGADATCSNSEGVVHALAKELLKAAVGREFILPTIWWKDGAAHISRFTMKGHWRSFRNHRSLWSYLNNNRSANYIYKPPLACEILAVYDESDDITSVPEHMRADIVLTLKINGVERNLAVEIRDTHAKTLPDVLAYAAEGMSVIEIGVGDIDPQDRHLKARLWNRLLGKMDDTDSTMREWLYNDGIGRIFKSKFCWRIAGCDDPKLMLMLRYYFRKLGLEHLLIPPANQYKDNENQWRLFNIADDNVPVKREFMWCYDKINDDMFLFKQALGEVEFRLYYDKTKEENAVLNGFYDLDDIIWLTEEICKRSYNAAHDSIIKRESFFE